jgi:hypothetical protein
MQSSEGVTFLALPSGLHRSEVSALAVDEVATGIDR